MTRKRFHQFEKNDLRAVVHTRLLRHFPRRERLSRFVKAAVAEEVENPLLMAQGGLLIVGTRFDVIYRKAIMRGGKLNIRRTELFTEELPPRFEIAKGNEKTDLVARRAQVMERFL